MLLDDLASYLQSQSVGQVTQDIFLHELPDGLDAPDRCLMLRETGGQPPVLDHTSNLAAYERPAVQIIARGPVRNYEAARLMVDDAYHALLRLRNAVMSQTLYLSAVPLQAPMDLGSDANRRPLVGFSVVVEKELAG